MKGTLYGAFVALALAAQCLQAQPSGQAAQDGSTNQDALYRTVSDLDSEFFGAFNSCDAPGQLERHASFLDPSVEFYHDNGGVSWTRQDYVEKTRKNVCGNFRRKLTPGSLEVYPIKGFGAIEEGDQTFCDIKSKKCFGEAKFLIVWHQTPGGWRATRVFSYGHHAIK
ncbi:nuclear transport factor 2 family protein [Dyella japonica]|uniref:DUF4440 domain-containing protein n=1 Tax=Dyella japonica A8 TaxID=1217721 RepID=A0A075JX57_9GAMM|nr:nuclear transport factor 2 family protein [Dyella japonica]AIF46120.1 hypothetical protein HY57_02050 [Dyella japonica A8]